MFSSAGDNCRPRRLRRTLVIFAGVLIAALPSLYADSGPDDSGITAVVSIPEPAYERILGVIPNFQTVSDPDTAFVPLTFKGKWKLFAKESFDPFTEASALLGAAFSQKGNDHPKYGNGGQAYAQRVGAAVTDFTTQNLYSTALASVLHQDLRYYRKGPRKNIFYRTGYSMSQVVLTRQDSGKRAFNFSGVFGMGLGIATSNLYYPHDSRTTRVMESRIGTSFMGGVIGNMLAEFWPDIRTRLLGRLGPFKNRKLVETDEQATIQSRPSDGAVFEP